MAKYRKKPIVIEAVQWKGDNLAEILDMDAERKVIKNKLSDALTIETLEGDHEAKKFDWIIKGVNGELYPCKPDIFEKTYEKVIDEEDD